MNSFDRYFKITERGSTVGTEIRSGVATFLTMAYILFVNPQVLAKAGMPAADVASATAIASAIATLVMGLYANYPFALAPGMGLNAFFTYSVVLGMGVSYRVALAAVFVEGILFLMLAFGGIRTAVINAIPPSLKVAVMCGIGLFLAIIGFENAGIIVGSPDTLVQLGDLSDPRLILSLAGLVLIGILISRGVLGGVLIGIGAVTAVAWMTGAAPPPEGILSFPRLPQQTILAFDLPDLLSLQMVTVVLAFLFVDFFDTAGTLVGVGRLGGFLNERGELPGAGRAFTADALGTVAGAVLGTSTVTTFIESATGIEEGGRTGLTAAVVAVLFILAMFFTPVFAAIPAAATAPALIAVGALMMQGATDINWKRFDEALPAFLTIAAMPFTYSIANGIVIGIVTYVLIKLLSGRARETNPILLVLAVLLLVYYGVVRPG
ncbi:MAG TPA: NCS2 family permease [Rhodothermales bacterium]|nr:NCS2 family permease [Rhodothermales bacterium]